MLDFIGETSGSEPSEKALSRLNRELRAIGSCHQAMMRARDEPTLLAEVCRIVCEEAGYLMAWAGYAERDEAKTVRPVARAGHDAGYVDSVRVTWDDGERGRGPTGAAIRAGATVCIQDWETEATVALWRAEAVRRGYHASVALPLKDERGEAFGALTIYSGKCDRFDAEEIPSARRARRRPRLRRPGAAPSRGAPARQGAIAGRPALLRMHGPGQPDDPGS